MPDRFAIAWTDITALDPYWIGVAVWLFGFCLYLYGAHWRYSYASARVGTVLCWIGFAATAYPLLKGYQVQAFVWPDSFDSQNITTAEIQTVIQIAWLLGFSILIASWIRIVPSYIGWAGFIISMAATVASWTENQQHQAAIAIAGLVLVLTLLASKRSALKRRSPPGNYVAELLRLCHGDTAVASRLIKYEMKRRPSFSRQGAAMAAVEQLVRDRK